MGVSALLGNCPFIYFKWESIVLALISAITLCRLLLGEQTEGCYLAAGRKGCCSMSDRDGNVGHFTKLASSAVPNDSQ
jgi:hypothetical protein